MYSKLALRIKCVYDATESPTLQNIPRLHVTAAAGNDLVKTHISHYMLVGGFRVTWVKVKR
jgi:hypothetical protein